MAFTDNFGNPQGVLGRIALVCMDKEHLPLAKWGMEQVEFPENGDILDVGCGGGYNIKRMVSLCSCGKMVGLDISEESVKKARAVNKKEDRVEIVQGSVEKMPFGDCNFDLVTAYETVFFWPDLEKSFREVYRVVKDGGRFAVISNYGNPNIDWDKKIPCMTRYTANQIEKQMIKASFADVRIEKKGTMFCVVGSKMRYRKTANRTAAKNV